MMLQQNYFKPLKFTVRGFFFGTFIYLTQKHFFSRKKVSSRWKGRPISFGSGTGRLVFLSFSWQVMVSIFIRQFLTKQVAAWKIFTLPKNSRTDTKHDVGRGKCIYLLSNYMCHFEYPWGEKPENPSIFRKKHSFANTLAACPTNVTGPSPQERLQGNGELLKLRDAFQKLQEVPMNDSAAGWVHTNHLWTHYEGL